MAPSTFPASTSRSASASRLPSSNGASNSYTLPCKAQTFSSASTSTPSPGMTLTCRWGLKTGLIMTGIPLFGSREHGLAGLYEQGAAHCRLRRYVTLDTLVVGRTRWAGVPKRRPQALSGFRSQTIADARSPPSAIRARRQLLAGTCISARHFVVLSIALVNPWCAAPQNSLDNSRLRPLLTVGPTILCLRASSAAPDVAQCRCPPLFELRRRGVSPTLPP